MTKILHVSDTHGFHSQLQIPKSEDIDIIIHSGDCSNSFDNIPNSIEIWKFIDWYKTINCKYKIYIAGNHDTSIFNGMVTKDNFEKAGIIYLQDESININGLNIYGSPWVPTFGNWAFMRKREKMHNIWEMIPENTDILITHGPPKGVLDLSERRDRNIEMCGCTSLLKHINGLNIKLNTFGHIHDNHDITNQGTRTYGNIKTIFSNASCVTDRKFDKGITSNGNLIEI